MVRIRFALSPAGFLPIGDDALPSLTISSPGTTGGRLILRIAGLFTHIDLTISYLFCCAFSILAHESRNGTIRLNISPSPDDPTESTQK